MHYRSGGKVRHPLPTLEQNVIALVWRTGRLPSEILAEDEYWINRLLCDLAARAGAQRKG